MKASTLGAAMVAHNSSVPTPNPASSLAVIFSISCFCILLLSYATPPLKRWSHTPLSEHPSPRSYNTKVMVVKRDRHRPISSVG